MRGALILFQSRIHAASSIASILVKLWLHWAKLPSTHVSAPVILASVEGALLPSVALRMDMAH